MSSVPAEAFHPGEYIADEISARGLLPSTWIRRSGIDPDTFAGLLAGTVDVDVNIATRLGHAFGTSGEVWMRLQRAYDEIRKQRRNDGPES